MKKINYNAAICSTGYGVVSTNILKRLIDKYDISLFPIGNNIQVDNEEDYKLISTLLDSQAKFDKTAPCIKIWHQFDLASRIGNGKYLGFPIFELDTFDNKEVAHLKSTDSILVCSHWAKNIIENNNINIPIFVVPLGIDTNIFDCKKYEPPKNNNYIFGTIGKWELRKGHDIIIECFNQAFDDKDDVELWLVTHNPFLNDNERNYWHDLAISSKLNKKIKIFNRLQTHIDVANIINYINCGLYLSRAEGWNLELLETISMNKPVIATNYSGHTEFCNNDNSYLIDIDKLEPAIDNKWFFGTGQWAKIEQSQKDQIIYHMRECFKNRVNTNPGCEKTKNIFTWENSANALAQCIS